ncbi:MAG: methionine synthase [Candidatus Syntrophoarchaeum sp.]|nr:methionine synthase [Candidatus Syntrophoarchaeum sp.]
MKTILFDDIGSFPLPDGMKKAKMERLIAKRKSEAVTIIEDTMQLKLNSGVEIANYPQFLSMIDQFLKPIMDSKRCEEPFLIREDEARIEELEILEPFASNYMDKTGERLKVRVCVTGPAELYRFKFGDRIYEDLLENLSRSIDRFIKRAVEFSPYFDVRTVSLDEPSLGIVPFADEMVDALNTAAEYANRAGIDVQIHLHTPILYDTICKVDNINIIGIESAANPEYLKLIDPDLLKRYGKFLRVGVARTDLFRMGAEFNEAHDTNVFQDERDLEKLVDDLISPQIVFENLKNAYEIFGDLIKYAGPDCGLGSWKSQRIASKLLGNVRRGMEEFDLYRT